MKILFVHPPGSYADMPTLAIPCLAACLKAERKEVYAWDANLDFLDTLLHPENLLRQEDRIRSGAADRDGEVPRNRRLALLPKAREALPEALSVLKDPIRYYDIPSHNRALRVIRTAVDAYNTDPGPLSYSFDSNGFSVDIDRSAVPFSFKPVFDLAMKQSVFGLLEECFEAVRSRIEANGPFDLIAVTCPNPKQLFPLLVLTRLMREARWAPRFVLGGSFVTTAREAIANSLQIYDLFDFIVTHEGEEALSRLVQALEGRIPLEEVPNLHRRDNGRIVRTDLEQIRDLGSLPTPDFSVLPLTRYWTPEPVLPAYAGRGCHYDACAFCNHHENYFGAFRRRPVDRVIEDLRAYGKKYGTTKFFFTDESLLPSHHIEIAEGIARDNLDVRWYCHSRVERHFSAEKLETLIRGGVTLLHVGMESANTRVLSLMNKGYDRAQVERFLTDLSRLPLSIHLNVIRGYPGETPKEYIESIETAWELTKAGDFIHLYPFSLERGSPIAREGSPYLTDVSPSEHDMDGSLTFTTKGVPQPTDEEKAYQDAVSKQLGSGFSATSPLYPEGCCWAAHLLYVSNYRDKGSAENIDRPRPEADLSPPLARAFLRYSDIEAKTVSIRPGTLWVDEGEGPDASSIALNPADFVGHRVETALRKAFSLRPRWSVSELRQSTGLDEETLRLDIYGLARTGLLTLEDKA